MSIDPIKTLDDCFVMVAENGNIVIRSTLNGATLRRVFEPVPNPGEALPRDQWANIKPGMRVRIADPVYDFSCEFVVEQTLGSGANVDLLGGGGMSFSLMGRARERRVWVLSEPADPDAELIEKIAAALDPCSTAGQIARAALAVVRAEDGAK